MCRIKNEEKRLYEIIVRIKQEKFLIKAGLYGIKRFFNLKKEDKNV